MEQDRDQIPRTIQVPAPTAWPMISALGITLAFAGLVTTEAVSVVGIGLAIAGAVGWFREVFPDQARETVRIDLAGIAIPVHSAARRLAVGEEGHRAVLPIRIYPYTAGIRGGLAGGFAMALLAVVEGLLLHGSPWYTVNILAATAMANLAHASVVTLSTFNVEAFLVAVMIHGAVSVLVGLLYGVLLPVVPRNPIFFGGVATPLLWTGLLYSSLKVINPVLDARIEWGWFVSCQIAFGVAAGLVVSRSERVRTLQHVPFALRMGVEAPGAMTPKEPR